VCESDSDNVRWAAAAAVGNIAERNPKMVKPHTDRLIKIFDNYESIRDSISSALIHSFPVIKLPVIHLVSLISEDGDAGKHAVDILGSLAIHRPQTLPSTEINQLEDEDDLCSHPGSKYLTTLLAAAGHGQAPHEPTISGFVEFGHLWHRAGSNGVLNQHLSSVITKRAVDDLLKSTIDEIGYKKMDLSTTPQGTQMIIYSENPGISIGEGGERIKKITQNLEEIFGFEKLQIDVQEYN
jgi:hypothetical protein